MADNEQQELFELEERKPIKGFPTLNWTGKRPFRATQYFPAQKKETYGESKDGWFNKIFWGDNLQVMSHLLRDFRGKVDLIYIDPPFDSKADYKKKIKVRGKEQEGDYSGFEEKQYGDIWNNDEYLQFMYERLMLCYKLLSDRGTIFLHCDWHKSHYLKLVLDSIFSPENFQNEIIWQKIRTTKAQSQGFGNVHDCIFSYHKTNAVISKTIYKEYDDNYIKSHYKKDETGRFFRTVSLLQRGQGDAKRFGEKLLEPPASMHWIWSQERIDEAMKNGLIRFTANGRPEKIQYLDEMQGDIVDDLWTDIYPINSQANEALDYPTQKPEALLERIINASSNPGDIVFDCFMGSGTTQAVAMKLGRRFIGADINLGSIQTTTKRLCNVAKELNNQLDKDNYYTGFEVYNVNNYDFFRNPVEAKELIIEALQIQKMDSSSVFDGEKDGRMVKIMPVNRIATRVDLEELKSNLPYKTYAKKKEENPNEPVEYITLVCMGHEPDLKAAFEQELSEWKFDIEIVDILRDKSLLQLKREAEALVVKEGNKLVIKSVYPLNLMQKLSLQKEKVDEWKQLVESVMIDWNYDGAVMEPAVIDIPEKNEFVKGEYEIPASAGTIRVKITDLLSESLEVEVK